MSLLRSMILSRTLRAVALAILVGVGAVAPVPVAGATASAVSWKTDDLSKIITANVRITITPACTPGQLAAARTPAAVARCHVTDDIARAIKENIEKVWNGHQYYCYDVVVKVDVKVDDHLNPPDPTDRVEVRIDQSPVYMRNFVSASESSGATWDGNSPSDQLTPQNNGASSSLWRYPAVRPGINTPNLYAHEAGHVMGVHDTYEDYTGADHKLHSRPKAGAAVDVMNSTAAGNVEKATINRLVERAGIKKTDLKCNYQIDHPSLGGRIAGRKCDAPRRHLDRQGHVRRPRDQGQADVDHPAGCDLLDGGHDRNLHLHRQPGINAGRWDHGPHQGQGVRGRGADHRRPAQGAHAPARDRALVHGHQQQGWQGQERRGTARVERADLGPDRALRLTAGSCRPCPVED